MATKSRIDYAIADLNKIAKAKKDEGYEDFYFVATLTRGKAKCNGVERGDPKNLSKLLRSYVKTENPDTVVVSFHDSEDHRQLYRRIIDLGAAPEPATSRSIGFNGLDGFGELGAAQINELVDRKVTEWQRDTDAANRAKELEELKVAHHAACCERDELSDKLKKKEGFEHIMTIIGAALPGVAGFFQGTPLGPIVTSLAGVEAPEQEAIEGPQGDDNRSITLNMLGEYLRTLTDQQLAAMQLICMNLERDPNEIQVLLNHYMKKQQKEEKQPQTAQPLYPNGHIQQQQAATQPA